jgi:DNA-binding response OmpR family regulator
MSSSVLIVEDEILVALMLEAALADAGFDVVGVYRSGAPALACLQREAVDLVIVDLLLEGEQSGIDFADAVRAFWAGPILFHTAVSDPSIRQRMAKVPNATMILKPTSEANLVRAVRGLLSKDNPPQ